MAAGNPSLYLRIEPQSQISTYGNCGTRIPLYFSSTDDRNGWMGALGIPVTGKHRFNDTRLLRFKITNFDGTDAQFTTLELHFLGIDTFFAGEAQITQIDLINFAG